jgi:superfamily I DNA/RNA helicase
MRDSTEQQLVYRTWQEQNCNLVIDSVAGSGKTTVLLKLLSLSNLRTLFLAFNKSIQEEITYKTSSIPSAKALTIHSLGLDALRKYYAERGHKIVIKNNKNWELIKAYESMNKLSLRRLGSTDKMKLFYSLIDMNDISRIFCTDDYFEIRNYMRNMDKIVSKEDYKEQWEEFLIYRKEFYEAKNILIDFNDMIYLPAIIEDMKIPIEPYNLFVDEVQDLNVAQLRFVDKLLNQGFVQRFVAVGDTRQSIYGFSGSFGQSFNFFLEKPNTQSFSLTTCYRCPTKVIGEANKVYNVMQAFKTTEGHVETLTDFKLIKEKSLVICRNTAPLLDLYFKLLSIDKPVFLKGEDILNAVVKILNPYGNLTVENVITILQNDIEFYKNKETKSDSDNIQIWKTGQQIEHLQLIIKAFNTKNLKSSEVVERFRKICGEKERVDSIVLCTIHKAKGLESEIVYVLNENLIPSPMARSEQQLKQEQNLKYVARTRATEEMFYLNI